MSQRMIDQFLPPHHPRVYLRPRKLPNGGEDYIRLPACSCRGVAAQVRGKWTIGRRGPVGGVCGACGGAITEPNETGMLAV